MWVIPILPHPAPNGQKNFRQLPDEVRLQFWREYQVTVALVLRGERGEDPASYTEVRRPHVRSFLGPFEAQCNPAEIYRIHRRITPIGRREATTRQRWDFSGLLSLIGDYPQFGQCIMKERPASDD
jgi:hypothetical protein